MKKQIKPIITIFALFTLTVYVGVQAFNSEVNFSKKTIETSTNNYNSSNKPSVKYSSSKIINQYSTFDPKSVVDTNYYVEVTYNDVDTNIPGDYTVVLKVCYYKGDNNCRSVKSSIRVKAKTTTKTTNTKSYTQTKNYYAGPTFSNSKEVSCYEGNSSCLANKISKPTAKDPYSSRSLEVTLIDGYVDINEPGTYSLIYYAVTEHGVSGTIAKLVTINESYSSNSYLPRTKYVDSYRYNYYDDGLYAGYLNSDVTSTVSKYISRYAWYNTVYYTYRCTNVGSYGTDGWAYISTDTSDDHPTYYYENDSFSGTLNKTSFACVNGCTEKLIPELGICNYYGETKQITRTFVGYYSGYVYSNQQKTYSGTVYLK